MKVMTPKDIGALVRSTRRRRGLSQAALAHQVGATQGWISEVESGKPTAEIGKVLLLLAWLGIRLDASEPMAPESIKRLSGVVREVIHRRHASSKSAMDVVVSAAAQAKGGGKIKVGSVVAIVATGKAKTRKKPPAAGKGRSSNSDTSTVGHPEDAANTGPFDDIDSILRNS